MGKESLGLCLTRYLLRQVCSGFPGCGPLPWHPQTKRLLNFNPSGVVRSLPLISEVGFVKQTTG